MLDVVLSDRDTHGRYLMADFSIHCFDSRWKTHAVFAGVMAAGVYSALAL